MKNLGGIFSKHSWMVLFTLCAGGVGAFLAYILGAPAPWLTGPALVVTLLALNKVPVTMPVFLRDSCFLVIGMTMGAGITPEAIDTARQWPATIITLCVGLLVIVFACGFLLERLFKFDKITALLSSTPGHLSYVLSLTTDTKADITSVSIIQSLRVLVLTLAVPVLVVAVEPDNGSVTPVVVATMSIYGHLIIAALSLVAGLIFQRLKVPAALLLGGMVVSALFHASGYVEGSVMRWASVPAFILMGTTIGTRFANVTWAQISQSFLASLVVTVGAIIVTVIGAYLVVGWTGLPLTHVLIAFAPGGLETMAAMGILMGANPAFIAAHHASRLLLLTLFIPVLLRISGHKGARKD